MEERKHKILEDKTRNARIWGSGGPFLGLEVEQIQKFQSGCPVKEAWGKQTNSKLTARILAKLPRSVCVVTKKMTKIVLL